jgi:hypothetical protein
MKRRHAIFLGSIIIAVVLFSITFSLKRQRERAPFAQVEFGMSSNKVFSILGPPTEASQNSVRGDVWTFKPSMFFGSVIAFTTNGVVRSINHVNFFGPRVD